jgi:hypothetical protein
MARQYLQSGPFGDVPIADPLAADTATTAVGMWNSMQFTLIPAWQALRGTVWRVEAGGLITTAATGALTISPSISTSNAAGTTLGASIAQTVPASSLSGPWHLCMNLIVTATGAPGGTNASMKGTGRFVSGGVAATANSGLTVTFGGTAAAFDQSVNQSIWISKTLSVAGSFTTQYAFIYPMS